MERTFKEAMKDRRSIYGISSNKVVSEEKMEGIIADAIKHVPSAFNAQSSRVVLLYGDYHKRLWDITMDTLKEKVPADKFSLTEAKINSFKAGFATILYFDDEEVTNGFADQFKTYAKNFPVWAEQSNGMLQFAIWTMLEEEGLGVNVQHYNPLIDEQIKAEFKIPSSWRLIAQMPVGSKEAEAGVKEFEEISKRFMVKK